MHRFRLVPGGRQLKLVDLLLSASLEGSDPALQSWIHERVESTYKDESSCHARFKLRCEDCGRIEIRDTRCGPECPHCREKLSRRARVVGRIARVCPDVPSRHLVLSLPRELHTALARGQLEEERVQGVFEKVVFSHLRDHLLDRYALPTNTKLGCGAVSVVHGFSTDLRYAPHLHALVLDGAFTQEDGRARFLRAAGIFEPERLTRIAAQIYRDLHEACSLRSELASAVQNLRQDVRGPRASSTARAPQAHNPPREGHSHGVRVFAGPVIKELDRVARRRVLEYLSRPPLSPAEAQVDARGQLRIPASNPEGQTLPASEVARRVAAVTGPHGGGTLRQHGLMVGRSAKGWGLVPQQLPLIPPSPAKRRTRSASRVDESTESGQSKRVPACRHCGGGLRPIDAEELT